MKALKSSDSNEIGRVASEIDARVRIIGKPLACILRLSGNPACRENRENQGRRLRQRACNVSSFRDVAGPREIPSDLHHLGQRAIFIPLLIPRERHKTPLDRRSSEKHSRDFHEARKRVRADDCDFRPRIRASSHASSRARAKKEAVKRAAGCLFCGTKRCNLARRGERRDKHDKP